MLIFPDWIGEFGWELMTFQATCRRIAKELRYPKDRVLVRSFHDMEPIYSDFATFAPHDRYKRAISFFPKTYRTKGEWVKFGTPRSVFTYLIHARNDRAKSAKNCPATVWTQISDGLEAAASIGTLDDLHLPGTADMRAIPIAELMDLMAGAKKVIGQSSGPMHLAALCGADLIVWGDNRTYFGETLEKRYKETWNPFGVHVDFVYTGMDWKPNSEEIRRFL